MVDFQMPPKLTYVELDWLISQTLVQMRRRRKQFFSISHRRRQRLNPFRQNSVEDIADPANGFVLVVAPGLDVNYQHNQHTILTEQGKG